MNTVTIKFILGENRKVTIEFNLDESWKDLSNERLGEFVRFMIESAIESAEEEQKEEQKD